MCKTICGGVSRVGYMTCGGFTARGLEVRCDNSVIIFFVIRLLAKTLALGFKWSACVYY